MVKSKILFFLLGSSLVWAREFPKLCPNEQNLPEICEQIRQISPNQVLVFEDGFTMNTCSLLTVGSQESRLREIEKSLTFEMGKIISNRYPSKVNQMAEAFRNPLQGKKFFPALKDEFEKLQNIRESIGIYEHAEVPITTGSLNKEVEFAAESVRTLAKNKASEKQALELQHLMGIIDTSRKSDIKVSEAKISCRPNITAFYSFDNKKITMNGLTHFPVPSRVGIFGHEVCHGIETCHFTKYREKKPEIFLDLESCVRSDLGFNSKIHQELQCDRHTAEAFCDHVGVHVLEDYLRQNPLKVVDSNAVNIPNKIVMPPGYQNIMIYLDMACSERASETHPAGDRRFLDILMRSPVIAKSLNCAVNNSKPRCSALQGLIKGTTENPATSAEKPTESTTQR